MRVSPGMATMVLCAATAGWFARGSGIALEPAFSPALPIAAPVPAEREPAPEPLRIARLTRPDESPGSRDLFAFREEVHPTPRAAVIESRPVAVSPTPLAVVPEPAPSAPPFPYRFIGRFGPAGDPIAVFWRDGEILTVRGNDRIDSRCLLRSVGMQSVEVECTTSGQTIRQRVPLFGEEV